MKFVLWFVVIFHVFIILMNIASLFILPFMAPWYVASPLVTYLLALFTTSSPCPLTKLEDKIRVKMGKPPIKHFIGHYFVWPLKRALGKKRKNRGVAE